MLPDSGIDPARSRVNPYMFADTGIPKLLEEVCGQGASRRRLVAHAAGGASIMDPQAVFDIGKRNYLASQDIVESRHPADRGSSGRRQFAHGPAGDRQRPAVATGRRGPEGAGTVIPTERRKPMAYRVLIADDSP